jgi:hypothetical protein
VNINTDSPAGGISAMLTREQKEVMLKLGDPNVESTTYSYEILQELVRLGLVYERGQNHYDFTDDGEAEYDRLKRVSEGFRDIR